MTRPSNHVDEALKLTADGLVHLYELALRNVPEGGQPVVRFRDGPMGTSTTWGGNTYEHLACKMSGSTRSSEGERSRPTLQVMNPVGVFNDAAFKGRFDGAFLTKYIVLRRHIEQSIRVADTEMWFVGRVKDLVAGQSISFELRSLSDGPEQLVPARMYIPPNFPLVTF